MKHDVIVRSGESYDLPAGTYRNVTVEPGAKLIGNQPNTTIESITLNRGSFVGVSMHSKLRANRHVVFPKGRLE